MCRHYQIFSPPASGYSRCVHKKCHKFVSAKCSTWNSRTENAYSSPALHNGSGNASLSTHVTRSPFLVNCSSGPVQENRIESHEVGIRPPLPPTTAVHVRSFQSGRAHRNGTAAENGHSENGGGMGLDDFELLTVIGRGSYAKVVQAEHKQSGQIYAIKIIKKSLCTDEEVGTAMTKILGESITLLGHRLDPN